MNEATNTYRVFATRTEIYIADVEATSAEEAERLADENYSSYDFYELDDSLETTINYGRTILAEAE